MQVAGVSSAGAGLSMRQLLVNLGGLMCTQREIAAMLGVTEKTIIAFFKRVPEAKELFLRGTDMGKVSLRRAQFELANKNATMAIFLGKTLLGQKDRREFDRAGDIASMDIANMPTEMLIQLCRRIDAALGDTGS